MVRRLSFLRASAAMVVLLGCADPPLEPASTAPGDAPLLASALTLGAPDSISASGVSETQIAVGWRDNAGNETRFEVYRSTTGPGDAFSLLTKTEANVEHYTDAQLQFGALFCYKVRAARTTGGRTTYSAFSTIACAQPPPPAAPSNAGAVALSGTRIDVSWTDNSSTETRFLILRSVAGGTPGTFTYFAWPPENALVYSDQSVTAETRYCYQVEAVRDYSTDGSGTSSVPVYSPPSNTACATSLPPSAPPSGTYAISGARPENSSIVRVTATWTGGGTAPALRMYRSTDGGGTWIVVSVKSVGIDEYADASVPSEQRVCYRAVAYNGAGEGPPSAAACTAAPAGPTNLVGVQVSGQIDLTWRDNSTVEGGYEVWLRTHGSTAYCYDGPYQDSSDYYDAYSRVVALAPGTTTYRAVAHEPDTCDPTMQFWYYVVATKDGGTSDFSKEVSAASIPAP